MANKIVIYVNGRNQTLSGSANGDVPTWDAATSAWVPQAGGGGSGTVTSITAGTGLTGGTITTSGTIAADFGTVSGKVAEGDDARFNVNPSAGNARLAVTAAGAWSSLAPGTDGNTLSMVSGAPAWAALNLAGGSNYVTGTLPLANVAGPTGIGFGVTSATGVWAAAAIADTDKLVGFNGTTPSAITVGSGLTLTGGTLSASGGGGTVTSVTSTSALLSVANGTTTPALTVNTGTTSSTVAIGDDTRFNPAPSGAGKLAYDNGTAYVALAAGTSTQVLHGGAAPSWGAVNLATDVTGSLPASSVSQNPYDFGGEFPGTPTTGEECFHYVACRAFTLPAGTDGAATCETAPSGGTTTFDVLLNGTTSIGSIVYTSGNPTGTLTITAPNKSIVKGDKIMVKADAANLYGLDTPSWQFFAYI